MILVQAGFLLAPVALQYEGVSSQAIANYFKALPVKVLDNDRWIAHQFDACNFGDTRRTARLKKVATNMLCRPEESLPAQNSEWSDLKAAYRFFDCPEVTLGRVAEPHWKQTRLTPSGRYLLISDTTDINHFAHRATEGLGMLGDGVGRGMQLHSCLMFDCEQQQVRGLAGALTYYRKSRPKHETRNQTLARLRESSVWGDLVEDIGSAPAGARWIHVFDRGGDNFEAICHVRLNKCDWIIRAAKLNRKVRTEDGTVATLQDVLDSTRQLGTYELNLRSRPGVAAHTARIEVSVVQVTFPRPRRASQWLKQCGISELPMNVVLVREINAPKGRTPIRWVLLTSLMVDDFEQAWQVIEDYEHRWLIEEYHKVLKSGCSIEAHALRTADRLEPLIGLISVIAIRLLQLKLIGRNQPKVKAAAHVPAEWLRCLQLLKPKIAISGLTVYEFFREIAKCGGFLGRRHDGEPGWQTIWRGLQRIHHLLDGIRLAGTG